VKSNLTHNIHFGVESFQTIDCNQTDNNQQKIHAQNKKKSNLTTLSSASAS